MKHLILIFLIPLSSFCQIEMKSNRNFIDSTFIENPDLVLKILKSDGNKNLRLFLEKGSHSLFNIYLLNSTRDSIKVEFQDWSLYTILEAKNLNGNWEPVEYWEYSDCGNSYLNRKLAADEIIKTESLVYTGKFETKLRFKLLNYDEVYYSNEITGNIELSQFEKPNLKSIERFNFWLKRSDQKTMEDYIFLEPKGREGLVKKNKEYLARMAELRKQNNH